MMLKICIFAAFLSAILFSWPFTVCLALCVSAFEPIVPLAVGLFVDALYYIPSGGGLPFFTLSGASVTIVALFVRGRLKASIIER